MACDSLSGECPCYHNFTSRVCDKCAAKYYNYPDCLECGCSLSGSKGVTCDIDGQVLGFVIFKINKKTINFFLVLL